jgi:transcriptional regulator with XRE-family HTH domain
MGFPEQLREAMGDLNQSQLSELSGVAQTLVSRHLLGKQKPSIETLELYERALPRLSRIRKEQR